jgi:hypothetical protein
MKTPLTIIFIFQIIFSFGQSLEQQVIGSSGNFSSTTTGTTLSSTTGEVITTTSNSGTAILTQGFQQPVVVTSLSSVELTNNQEIIIYPNPSNYQITIIKEQTETLYAELIDVLGQVISTHKLTKNNTEINLEKLASGTYFFKIKNNIKQAVQTFKIQKIQ